MCNPGIGNRPSDQSTIFLKIEKSNLEGYFVTPEGDYPFTGWRDGLRELLHIARDFGPPVAMVNEWGQRILAMSRANERDGDEERRKIEAEAAVIRLLMEGYGLTNGYRH
jgi:hypothetical protein